MAASKKATQTQDEIGDPTIDEVAEAAVESASWDEGGVADNTGNTPVEKLVNEVILLVRGIGAKIDRERMLAVCDLAERGVHHGREFRQLFIQADSLAMTIRLVQTVKSSYGGATTSDTVAGFKVPVGESVAYNRLYRRFFAYNEDSNVQQGERLVDSLRQTVS